MLRSIDMSRAGMLRQQQYLDATAHNVANAGTPGFKAVRAALESGDVPPAGDPAQATGTATPAFTARINIGRLFTQGALRDTGSQTDMAIDGDGFFALRRPDGSDAYTRNGSFQRGADGRLTDGAGNLLQPPVTVPQGAAIRVAQDGAVTAVLPDGRSQQVGQLQLARFANSNGLVAGANGLFTATAASGPAQLTAPGQNGAGGVRNGVLEEANTDITEQMSNLVAAQRAYQLNTSAFRMSDEMLRMANQLQGNS